MRAMADPPATVCTASAGQIKPLAIKSLRPATPATGSDVLRRQLPRPRIRLRLDVDRPQIAVIDILQGNGHDAGLAVDIDAAEELQPETGREIFALARAATFLEHRLRPKGVVEFAGRPGARMQRA